MSKDFWQTPEYILKFVRSFFGLVFFDPCPANPTFNGLEIKWPRKTFINPPFSEYLKWVKYGMTQEKEQIWLGHHKHDAEWCRTLIENSSVVLLLRDRIHFVDPKTGLQSKKTDIDKRQTLFYIGRDRARFARCFQPLGYPMGHLVKVDKTGHKQLNLLKEK